MTIFVILNKRKANGPTQQRAVKADNELRE
jgi:hypothetical protein